MKLRFLAARDSLVPERHLDGNSIAPQVGQPYRYVGRVFDAALRGYPASSEAFECESGTGLAAYLIREACLGVLLPADEATAKACGVPFVPHEFSDGVWVPSSAEKQRVRAGKAD